MHDRLAADAATVFGRGLPDAVGSSNVRGMRWISALIISATLSLRSFAADVEFVRVWPQWRSAESFERIGEYFGRAEQSGREVIARSQPAQRAGLYFLVRVNSAKALPAAKFVVDVIRPDSPEPKTFTFPVSLPGRSAVFQLGLTGSDWPDGRDVHPVAWRVSVVDEAGHPVATEQSFLWATPRR